MSNNVVLHPTARVEAPVFVGRNCRILEGARIGPNAVIGHDCIVDSHSAVSEAVVFPGTYVGEGLELDHAIADRNLLLSVKVGAAIRVTDDFLLSSLRPERRRVRGQYLSRIAAAVLVLALAPAILLVAFCLLLFRRGPVVSHRSAVRIPADHEQDTWSETDLVTFSASRDPFREEAGLRHLCFCFLPGLLAVARGDLRFVGVGPRSAAEIERLPDDWRALYLDAKAGIVSEAWVQYGPHASVDDLYTAEVFYSVSAGRMYDFRLLCRYFATVFSSQSRWQQPESDLSAEVDA